jgi:hypothetical protein
MIIINKLINKNIKKEFQFVFIYLEWVFIFHNLKLKKRLFPNPKEILPSVVLKCKVKINYI